MTLNRVWQKIMLRRDVRPNSCGLVVRMTDRVVAFLVAISQSGIVPGDQFKLKTQNEKPTPPKLPEFIPEQPAQPFKSLVLDAAQSYFVTGQMPVAPVGSDTEPSPSKR